MPSPRPDALAELRTVYAQGASTVDAESVAQLLAAVIRSGRTFEAGNALVAFRARRGFCFRDRVRERLDELAPVPRRAAEAGKAWALRAFAGQARSEI
jgi:hypothetical protein